MRFTLSVVIPTYRRTELLDACLESLFSGGAAGLREVILVVHEADAATRAAAARWAARQPLVRIVSTASASRSAARNSGVAAADGDWCWFLDDDVRLPPGALAALRAVIEQHPEAAAVGGPNLAPPDSGLFERCVDRVLRSRFGAGTMRSRYEGLAGRREVDERSLIGCNLAVYSKALREDRAFDEGLDYGEETLLLARLAQRGQPLLYLPELWVYHRRRSDWSGFCRQAFRSGMGRAKQTAVLPASFRAEFAGPPLLALALLLSIRSPGTWILLWAVPYLALAAGEGLAAFRREGDPFAAAWVFFLLPAGHLSYGFGFLAGAAEAFLRLAAGARDLSWKRWAADTALSLARLPWLRPALRFYYASAVRSVTRWAGSVGPGVREVWLHRGMAGGDWSPGGSDIDLLAEISPGTLETEREFHRMWQEGYGRLRRLFPVLGEVQMATRPELEYYLRHGPLRAAALSREARPLLGAGSLPALQPDPGKDPWLSAKRGADAWTEAAHAYARLLQCFFDHGADRNRTVYHGRKLFLDILRYGRLLGGTHGPEGPWDPLTRRAMEGALSDEEQDCLEVLAADPTPRGLAAAAALAARKVEAGAGTVLERLDKTAAGAPKLRAAAPLQAEADAREGERFAELCREIEGELGPGFTFALHDSVFQFLLGCSAETLERAEPEFWTTLRGLKRRHRSLSGALLPLGASGARLLLYGAFSQDPCAALSLPAPANFSIRSGKAPLLAQHLLSGWGLPSELRGGPPVAFAQAMVMESWAHLALNWRVLEGVRRTSDLHRWVYLYSRVMSLRLFFETGEAWPAFPLEPLARRFAQVHPETSDWLKRGVLEALSTEPWPGHWDFFAVQMRTSLRRQA